MPAVPTTMHLETVAPATLDGTVEALPLRVRDIATLRGLGYSFREIGEAFGVTPQAVSLMLSRYRRSLQSLGGALDLQGLSTRTLNVLGRHGIRSREDARRCDVVNALRFERNCGQKTREEITRWLSTSTPAFVSTPTAEAARI
jgi:predicted transcriptional regulator